MITLQLHFTVEFYTISVSTGVECRVEPNIRLYIYSTCREEMGFQFKVYYTVE